MQDIIKRIMSVANDRAGADAILQAAGANVSEDELSDVDGSSSLSDIEDKDEEPDQELDGSDEELSNVYDEENDSEAETERLEESPNKIRTHQNVVLTTQNDGHIYNQSPSKLRSQLMPDHQDEEDDDDQLSDDEISLRQSPKSSLREEAEPPTAATSLEDSAGENKHVLSTIDVESRKRKRSIMAGSGLGDDDDGPLRKRKGSVVTSGDKYAVEDEDHADEEVDSSNPISGNISGDEEREEQEDEVPEEAAEPIAAEDEASEAVEISVSPKRRGRKKKNDSENGVSHDEDAGIVADGDAAVNGEDETPNADEESAENEGDDEAEAALRNEEERKFLSCPHMEERNADVVGSVEKKRLALEQLAAIEKQFATFKERSVSPGYIQYHTNQ